MGLFKRKKGGSLVGNLLAKGMSKLTGGAIGGKRSALLSSGQIDLINPNAKKAGKTLTSIMPDMGMNTQAILNAGAVPSPYSNTIADKARQFLQNATTNPDGTPALRTGHEVYMGASQNLQPIILIGLAIFGFTMLSKR